MNIIYLIIGLPGSGKTTLLNKFKRTYVVDDITDIKQLPDSSVKRIAISDPYLCRSQLLNRAIHILKDKYPKHIIKTIEFENNPDKALKNAQKRNNKKVIYLINSLSKEYKTNNKKVLSIY